MRQNRVPNIKSKFVELIRGILGAVRTTPVDGILGEIGLKRVEYELDETVERWGLRLVRREFGERFGKGEREDIEEVKV